MIPGKVASLNLSLRNQIPCTYCQILTYRDAPIHPSVRLFVHPNCEKVQTSWTLVWMQKIANKRRRRRNPLLELLGNSHGAEEESLWTNNAGQQNGKCVSGQIKTRSQRTRLLCKQLKWRRRLRGGHHCKVQLASAWHFRWKIQEDTVSATRRKVSRARFKHMQILSVHFFRILYLNCNLHSWMIEKFRPKKCFISKNRMPENSSLAVGFKSESSAYPQQ